MDCIKNSKLLNIHGVKVVNVHESVRLIKFRYGGVDGFSLINGKTEAELLRIESTYNPIEERSKRIELLEAYSKFLEEHGYMDADWRAEKPYAIDEFLKQ